MKVRNNEQGSALLMVLLLVLVFTILGVSLLSMNISASKQFNKKEEQVQARHLAEMGVLHYKAEVMNMLKVHNDTLQGFNDLPITQVELESKIGDQNDAFCSNLARNTQINEVDGNYKVTLIDSLGVGVDALGCTGSEKIILTVNSLGKVKSSSEVNIDAKLTIILPHSDFEKVGGDSGDNDENQEDDESPLETTSPGIVDNFTIQRGTNPSIVGDITIKKKLGSKPGNSGTNIFFKNNVNIEGVLEINNHACVAIGGNFLLNNNKHKFGPHLNIYIYGNANLPSKLKLNPNTKIYVNGDVLIDGKKNSPKSYPSVPSEFLGCGEPQGESGDTENESPLQKEFEVFEWDMEDSIEANYY